MKRKILIATILTVQLFAVDYSTFTNDELFNTRGTVSTDDRDAFRSEMSSRMQTLTPEERTSMRGSKSGARDGSGAGSGNKRGGGGGRR
jgi:uncharacterized membrane protein YgcG